MTLLTLEFALCFVSAVSAAITVLDKICAKLRLFRVPEKVLFLLAAAGGSAAMFITMLIIRHKTRHLKFMVGLPIIMLLQAAALYFVYISGYLQY